MISGTKPLVSEPKVIVTGVEGAGKTLFAVQQADLIRQEEFAEVYVVNIKEADPEHLTELPFKMDEMAYNPDGSPVLDSLGSHLPKWATLEGAVIIIDEAHKVFPQRGPGKPPPWIELLAEGRQFGVRIILLTQAPDGIDNFLRNRIHRHYHLERKGNFDGATIFEFDHCEDYPRKAWRAKKDATKHLWRFPKKYYGWYKSAASHHFKVRIPLKMLAAVLFVPLAAYAGYKVVHTVGGLSSGLPGAATVANRARQGGDGQSQLPGTDPASYSRYFTPIDPEKPWSAPAFEGRSITAEPELYCVAKGHNGKDGCHCYTEQVTPYPMPRDRCLFFAFNGVYNPFRKVPDARSQGGVGGGKPVGAREGPEASPPVHTMD